LHTSFHGKMSSRFLPKSACRKYDAYRQGKSEIQGNDVFECIPEIFTCIEALFTVKIRQFHRSRLLMQFIASSLSNLVSPVWGVRVMGQNYVLSLQSCANCSQHLCLQNNLPAKTTLTGVTVLAIASLKCCAFTRALGHA
jgi:hypothetical protein